MKKIFLLTILAIILSNCEISPRKANAEWKEYLDTYTLSKRDYNNINYTVFPKDDIIYHIYHYGDGSQDASIFVVNHTKELLEVELLKKQLKQLEK